MINKLVHLWVLGRFFVCDKFLSPGHTKKGLVNSTKGFLRIKKKIAISREKKSWKLSELGRIPTKFTSPPGQSPFIAN
jgi:hypothetical protein